ncbi:MAG: outer membrane beta-barrel protein [Gallionella sp.]
MKKILMAMAIGAAFVATSVSADPYIGAGLGAARTDTSNTASKIFVGYQTSEQLGFQVAYNDFGGYRGGTASAWSIAMVGTMPVNPDWDVSAKLGASENRTTAAGAGSHSDIMWGVGGGYNFNRNVALRLEYENFGKLPTDVLGNRWKVSNWGLNLKYSF